MSPSFDPVSRCHLYLSYSWNHGKAYQEFTGMLRNRHDFDYIASFISEFHPVNRSRDERKLYETIKNKIKFCDAVILLCGVYSGYSRWINKELIACKDELSKPVIAVQRFDTDPASFIVRENADIIVDWNADAIIDAIRKLTKSQD